MKILNIGILGYGTVGKGVFSLIKSNNQKLLNQTGYKFNVVAISKRCWDGVEKPDNVDCVSDSNIIVDREDIDVLIELIGGDSDAYNFVIKAINNGKHIVTANKALIATKGNDIFKAAKEKNVQVLFEASVAGGIPIVKALKEGLAANKINHVAGIINGTSNYILTSMRDNGQNFDNALLKAKELGYAEADPTFDIEGIDAAHKLTIMASIAFGKVIDFSQISIEGITGLSRQDIGYAMELGYQIKHLGVALCREKGIEVRVHPTLVPNSNIISKVDGVMNAVRVHGNAVGETLFYGAGAGALPTASAVVADIIDLINRKPVDAINPLGYSSLDDNIPVLDELEHKSSNYLRLTVKDRLGVLAKITNIFARNSISIDAMIQKEPLKGEQNVPLVFLTHCASERNLISALTEIENLEFVYEKIIRIRVEHF